MRNLIRFFWLSNLPIISATDNKFAGFVKLDIKNGRDLVSLKICVTKYSLHAAKLNKLLNLQITLRL